MNRHTFLKQSASALTGAALVSPAAAAPTGLPMQGKVVLITGAARYTILPAGSPSN